MLIILVYILLLYWYIYMYISTCAICILRLVVIVGVFVLGGGGASSSYGSWIYSYLCNHCLSPLKLWVGILLMYSIKHYVIKFVGDLRQVGNWNIVESGVKHHKPCIIFSLYTNFNLVSDSALSIYIVDI